MHNKHPFAISFVAGLLAITVTLGPAYAQAIPAPGGNQRNDEGSFRQRFRDNVINLKLQGTDGRAGATTDNAGVTIGGELQGQPVGGFVSSPGSPGSSGSPGGSFRVDIPPYSRSTMRGGGGPGDGSVLGGPPSQNTIPCGTPQFQCITTTGGSTLFVPGSSWGGTIPFAPAGPWVPSGPVTRLDPVGEAHNLVNHMPWPNVTIGVNPNPGVVAIKSWFWIQNYSGQVLTNSGTISETHQECRTVTVPGANPADPPTNGLECRDVTNSMTVDARVGPTQYQWTFGDGRAGSQQEYPNPVGLGRAYTDPHTSSPVAWSYEFSSLGHPAGFPIQVQITFVSQFRANGSPWAGLDPVTQTYTGSHIVEQVQPLRVASGQQGP